MLTPLSILSLDQGPRWTAATDARSTSRSTGPRRRLASLGRAALAAFAAAARSALRRSLRAG